MEHHETAGDRQAQAGALDLVAMGALERREHALERIGRDADAGVGYLDLEIAQFAVPDFDRAPARPAA